jgi:photosystem II stability/assembly factor-like uncharacterized protein
MAKLCDQTIIKKWKGDAMKQSQPDPRLVAKITKFSKSFVRLVVITTLLLSQIPLRNVEAKSISASGSSISEKLMGMAADGDNPIPVVSSLSQDSVFVGTDTFALQVLGSNFVDGSVIQWNGTDLATTYIDSATLEAVIDSSSVSTAGLITVTINSPQPGGGISNSLTFTINNYLPVLVSLSQSEVLAGGVGFSLALTGNHFSTDSIIRWNGMDLTTTFISDSEIQAEIASSLIEHGGTASLTVFSPEPGGGLSAALDLTINNPLPVITNLVPENGLAGDSSTTLHLTGSSFAPDSIVRWNGSNLTTTFIDNGNIEATIDSTFLLASGTAEVTVFAPEPGGGLSNALQFSITNGIPILDSLSQSSIIVGSEGFPLFIYGNHFVEGSVARWNGEDRTTTFINSGEISFEVTTGDLLAGAAVNISVFNPTPGGGESGVLVLTITNPEPVITDISPIQKSVYSEAFTLTLDGTGFNSNSVVKWNSTDLATTCISSTQLSVNVSTDMIAMAAKPAITVFNPEPGGGTSNSVEFTVNDPVPELTGLSPETAQAGSEPFDLILYGNYFVSNSTVKWDDMSLPVKAFARNELVVSISPYLVRNSGTVGISVYNPEPGGGTSGVLDFVITPSKNTWLAGSPEGGIIDSITIDPQNHNILYAATNYSAVYKSVDGGQSWYSASNGLIGSTVEHVTIDPNNSSILYTAIDAYVFKSSNAGNSWQKLQGYTTGSQIDAPILVDPNNSSIVFYASDWIFKSDDGGASWDTIYRDYSPDSSNIILFALDPQNPSILYFVKNSIPGNETLWRTTDGGSTWGEVSTPNGSLPISSFVISPNDSNLLFLSTGYKSGDSQMGVYESTDGGQTWLKISGDFCRSIQLVPNTDEGNALVNGGGCFVTDGFSDWQVYAAAATGQSTAIDYQDLSIMYSAGWEGVNKTIDGGATWQGANNGLYAHLILDLALLPGSTSTLLASTWTGGLWKSTDQGMSWRQVLNNYYGEDIVVDPQNPTHVFYDEGMYESSDGGDTWVGPATLVKKNLVINSDSSIMLYSDATGVQKSTDGGTTWRYIEAGFSTDLRQSDLFSDPLLANVFYAIYYDEGPYQGILERSIDGGETWSLFTNIPSTEYPIHLAIDPQNSSTIYLVTNDCSWYTSRLYKSTDNGETWNLLYTIESNQINVVTVDPANSNLVYLGTERDGVHRSTDGGVTWNFFNYGLKSFFVRDIIAIPNELIQTASFDLQAQEAINSEKIITATSGGIYQASLENPAPVLTSVTPVVTGVNGPSFAISANGQNFLDGSVIYWDNTPLATSYINDTQLSASVPERWAKSAGIVNISVVNPEPGGGISNQVSFTVINFMPMMYQKLSSSKVTFDWDDIPSATAYTIQLSTSSTFSSMLINTTVTSSSYAYSTALTNGKTYYWRVRPKYGTILGDWLGIWQFYSMTPPGKPILTSPASTTFTNDNTPEFNWAAAAHAIKYEIQLSKSSTFTTNVKDVTLDEGVLAYTPDALPDGLYYWRVRGIDDVGAVGAWSTSRSLTVDTTAPAVPKLYSPADSVTARGTPKYTWLAATGAKVYQYSYGATGDCNDTGYSPIYTSGELTTLYTTPPLQAINDATTPNYYWCVRAKDAAGNWSAWSASRKITIISVIPAAPALIAPVSGAYTNDTTPELSWKAVPYGVSYEVRVSRSYTFLSILEEPQPAEGELSIAAATYGDGKYYWQVRAVNREGEKGKWSAYRYFTLDTAAQAAPKLYAPRDGVVVLTTIPTLSTAAVSGAKYYQFQVSQEDTFVTTLVDVTKTTYSYTLLKTEALPFGTVYWRMRDIDAAGNASDWSATRSFTINILKSPKQNSYTLDTTPTFSWAAAAGALEYRIQVDTNESFSSEVPVIDINRVPSTSYTPTAAMAYNVYYWRMQVRTAAGWGNWTPAFKFIVTPTPPIAPVLISPISGFRTDDPTQTFTWKSVTGGDRYEIQISTSQYFTSLEKDEILETGVLEYTTTPFIDGRHYWRVRALNSLGAPGAWSSPRYFNKILPVPVLVSPNSTDVTSSLRPEFNWDDVTGASKYSIQISKSETFATILMSATPVNSTFTPTKDLPANTVLYWRVQALGVNGPSFWTSQSFTTGNPPSIPVLSAPVNINISSYEPKLTWNPSTGDPVYYQVQVANDKGFSTLIVEVDLPGTSYQVPPGILGDLTIYYWRVRSVNALEQVSSWSTTAWMRSPGTVSGKVTNAVSGLGVGGVIVKIKGTTLSATTDMDGLYSIRSVKPGYYTLLPADTNYSFSPSYILFTLSTVNLTGKNFKATEYLSVSGKIVLDPRAALMSQSAASLSTAFSEGEADVTMSESDPAAEVVSGVLVKDNQGNAVLTDATGEYAIEDARPGNYSLNLSKSGYSSIPIKRSFYLSDDAMSQYFMIAPPAKPSTVQIREFLGNIGTGASFSANGRFIVLPGQINEEGEIIDIYTGSVTTGIGLKPDISGDGRFVVFYSWNPLTSDDINENPDVYAMDRDTDGNGIFDEAGGTDFWRVSKMTDLSQYNEIYRTADQPFISTDGRTIVFRSTPTSILDDIQPGSCGNVFVHDVATRTTKCLDLPKSNLKVDYVVDSISANGRFLGLEHYTDANGFQAYVYDRDPDQNGNFYDISGYLEMVSVTNTGVPNTQRIQSGNEISADGRYSVFTTYMAGYTDNGNYLSIFLRDRKQHLTIGITKKVIIDGCPSYLSPARPRITPDGRYVLFDAGIIIPKNSCTNTNDSDLQSGMHTFLYDRDVDQDGIYDEAGATKLLVTDPIFTTNDRFSFSSENISADGRYLLFWAAGPEGNTFFLHDRGTNLSFSITGRITNGNGEPVPGVSIDAGNGRMAFTDQDGYYSFLGLPGGTYYLTPSSGETVFSPSVRAVVVPPNSTGQDFTVTSGYQEYSSLSGRIADAYNNPIPGVSVDDNNGHQVITDDQGNYAFNDLVNGEYTITPTKDGYEFHPLPVTLDTTGEDIRGLNFTGLKIFNVSGSVTTNEGIGIEGVSITDNFGNAVITDANGDFTIMGIPAGSYTFIAAKENYSFSPNWQFVDIGSTDPIVITFLGSNP